MNLNEIKAVVESADIIFNEQQINNALKQQAEVINNIINGIDGLEQPPLILVVMNGGLIYSGQLLPLLNFPVQIDYIHATRYRNTTTGHELEWKVYPQHTLKERVVIVLDDIFDEGYTLTEIVKYCQQQQAEKVFSSVLVTKDHDRRNTGYHCDFSALNVPDRYVFGFGMDYKGQLRNLNAIYAVANS